MLLTAAVVALATADVLPRWPGLLHLVALPPLDLVGDLGVLLAFAPDWPVFLLGTAVSLAVRSAVLALLLGGLTKARFLGALRFYALVAPFAFVAAAMLYGARAVLFYALFWLGALLTVGLLLLTAATPWQRPEQLRSRFAAAARSGLRAGTVGAYLALLTVLGAVADLAGDPVAVLLVPASALLTWVTAQALHRDPGWRAARRAVAALPALGTAALVLVAATGPAGPPRAPAPATSRPGSILLMSGIDSRSGSGAILEIDPHVLGWTCERTFYYSYAGPGDGQPQRHAVCPIRHGAAYERVDTLRSREQLVPFLEQQAAQLVPPGVVAGHSQGAWLVWQAAVQGRLPAVMHLVLVGPFPDHGVAYPPPGVRAPGGAGRALIDAIASWQRPTGATVFDPDSPLGREWLGHPDNIEQTLARPLPDGLQALSVPSVFDLPLMRDSARLPHASDRCPVPVIHPNLPYSLEFHDAVVRFVEGRPQPPCPPWRRAVGPLFRHFTVPSPAD